MPTKDEKQVTPRIWADKGWIKCKLPYDPLRTPQFSKELKSEINWKLRQWNKQDQLWLIDPSCLDELIAVARKYFPDLQVIDPYGQPIPGPGNRAQSGRETRQEGRKRPSPAQDDGTYQTIAGLLRGASTEALKRVYKALAADFHPDHGGDGDTLRRLNVAWDRIRRERRKQ